MVSEKKTEDLNKKMKISILKVKISSGKLKISIGK